MGQEMLTLSGTPDLTPSGEFMISPIHNNYILLNWSGLMILVGLPALV